MTNTGADPFGRVPPSAALGATLQRSADYARHQSHRRVTLEHLLLALCDDPDAGRVLAASRVDVRQIMIDASGFVGRIDDRSPPGQPVEPVLDGELSRILDYATVAAQQSGRREINGAIVLAAIVGDERSAAATMLRSQGLTFDEAISVLRQTARQPGDAPPQPLAQPAPAPAAPMAHPAPSTAQILAEVRTRVDAGTAGRLPAWASAAPMPTQPTGGQPPQWAPPPAAAAWQPAPPPNYQQADYSEQPYPQNNGYSADYPQAPYGSPQSQPAPYTADYDASASAALTQPAETPRTGRQPAARRRAKAATAAAPPVAVLQLTGVDMDGLARMLPDRLTGERSSQVEIRVAHSDLASLGVALGSGPGAARADLIVSRSLTVRLRSPDGRLTVEPVTPETQWIDRSESYLTADDICWRWTVTGRRAGLAAIHLSVAARTVAIDGMPVESALPDQAHDIVVSTNWVRVGNRAMVLLATAIGGALLAMSGSMLVDLAARVINRA